MTWIFCAQRERERERKAIISLKKTQAALCKALSEIWNDATVKRKKITEKERDKWYFPWTLIPISNYLVMNYYVVKIILSSEFKRYFIDFTSYFWKKKFASLKIFSLITKLTLKFENQQNCDILRVLFSFSSFFFFFFWVKINRT